MAIKKKAKKTKKTVKKKTSKAAPANKKVAPKPDKKDKHPGGRPPKYNNVQELQAKIDEYFDSCWIDKIIEVTDKDGNCTATNSRYQNRPYTVMGLVFALGFVSRQSLLDYCKRSGQFSDTIKRAKTKIEMNVEEYLLEGKNAAGPIFWLKNNAETKYQDKQELEHSAKEGAPPFRVVYEQKPNKE